jgi:hypothetical protein
VRDLDEYCLYNPDDPVCQKRAQERRIEMIRAQNQSMPIPVGAIQQGAKSTSGGSGPGLGTAAQLVAGVAALDKAGSEMDIGAKDQWDFYKNMGGKSKDFAKKLYPWRWFQ